MTYSKMTMLQTKRKRIRITRSEIQKAKESLGQEKQPRHKEASRPQMPKGFWQDGMYCDPHGWAWGLDEDLDSVCLGRIAELIKGGNPFPSDNDFHSCHLGVKNASTSTSGRRRKSVVATFKNSLPF